MAESLSCGQALIRLLEQHQVDTVFGIPGTHTLELYRGLARSRIRHVLPRHEQGAGFMADGYARASGRPGVCLLIAGPGLLNAATPIAQAYSDSVPLLIVSSVADPPPGGVPEGHIHELPDQAATMGHLTAFSMTLARPEDLAGMVERCFSFFRQARPRPVHIALPLGLLQREAPWPQAPEPAPPPAEIEVDGAKLAEAATLLRRARRPVMILGGGSMDCAEAARTVAERTGAVILTTIAGKGAVADDHRLHAGAALTTAAGRRLAESADVVLAIGTELAASDTWTGPLRFAGRLIRIDIDELALRSHPDAQIALRADLAPALAALARLLPEHGPAPRHDWGAGVAARCREESRRPVSELQSRHVRALEALRAAIPEDAMVAADMAQLAYTANVCFRCSRPRSYFYPVGLSTLGYALPAAIGAKLAAPDRAAIAITGDGGFLFTAAELGTAVECGLPIVVLLWNNDGLGQIRDRMTARNIPPIGVNPRNPDFLALARSFGCRTARPASIAGLKREIRAALRRRVPTVIEIHDDGAGLT
jgi:5-guanidino-2-oxopentanoate decarboxylase